MIPIYPECKFGIDDSINSITETILEKLKPKVYILTIVSIANNKESLSEINRSTIENVQLSQANKLFVCVSPLFTNKRNGITKKRKESQRIAKISFYN